MYVYVHSFALTLAFVHCNRFERSCVDHRKMKNHKKVLPKGRTFLVAALPAAFGMANVLNGLGGNC